jgi:hypothetical protein
MLEAGTMMDAMRYASEQEDSRNRMIASGIKKLLEGGGSLYDRYKRKSAIESEGVTPEEENDAEYRSAVNQFIETGNLSGLNAYKMRKMQEREMAMREEDIKSRKKLAELQDKQGKEDAEKINKEAIDEAMFELETAAVTKNSKTANEDEKKIADIKMKRALNTLKKLGVELEEISPKPQASNIPEGGEGGEDVPDEEPKIGDEESIQAQVNLFRRRMDEGFKTDAELQKFYDELVATSKANPEAKRNEEFNKLLKEAKNPYLSKEYCDRKESERKAALVNNYNSMDAMSRYTWSIENPKEFNEAKKLAEGK